MSILDPGQDQDTRRTLAKRAARELLLRAERDAQSERGWVDDDGVLQGGLMAFIRCFWPVIEPRTELVEGWALYAIVLHLEAVTFGDVQRLLINVPPGFMKSLCTDVFWPAWEWSAQNLAHLRYVTFSYSSDLTERHNNTFGALLQSPEFLEMWGDRVKMTTIGSVISRNTMHGRKIASSIGGLSTGERGDRVIFDDPHNVKQGESKIVREDTVRFFREAMSNRLNDMQTSAIVVIMQRVHEDDVAGAIISGGFDYAKLCIPMEYDPLAGSARAQDGSRYENEIGWSDPRREEDDLAWPERFPRDVLEEMKLEYGPYAWAAQYQQSPRPRGAEVLRREWWQAWQDPNDKLPPMNFILASVDTAMTEKEMNDPSAMTVWGLFRDKDTGDGRVILIDAWRKFLQLHGKFPLPEVWEQAAMQQALAKGTWNKEAVSYLRKCADKMPPKAGETRADYLNRIRKDWGLVEWVAHTCRFRKVDRLIIEGKANGLDCANELKRIHGREGWGIDVVQPSGDKYARALKVQPMFAQEIVYAPVREWAEMVISECEMFPKGTFRDLTDSTTQALSWLRDRGLIKRAEEIKHEEVEAARAPILKKKQLPLYPTFA